MTLNKERLEKIRELHVKEETAMLCVWCFHSWPCNEAFLLDDRDQLEAEVERLNAVIAELVVVRGSDASFTLGGSE